MFKVIYDGSPETVQHKSVFADTVQALSAEDSDIIYLDADLMNSSGTYKFWKEHPERVVNCGISEANMVGVAAGLSAVGKKPYVHTFGPFASRRCYDQAFLSVAYAGNSVRIFGSDPGVQAAFNGGTHMPFEDMALMRAVPESAVFDLADGVQLAAVLRLIKDRKGLSYLRSTRKNYKKIYSEDSQFEIGKGNVLRDGKDLTIIACGMMVSEALAAAEILAKKGIDARIIDMFTVKPIDKDLVIAAAKETGAILTTENHNVIGGLGDAVASVLLENCPVPMIKHGVNDVFGEVGPVDYLAKRFGLTADDVVSQAEKLLARK